MKRNPVPVRIITPTPDQRDAVVDLNTQGWFSDPQRNPHAEIGAMIDYPRWRIAQREDDGTWCGQVGAWEMGMTVPGPGTSYRRVPMYGLTWGSMKPDATRRGIYSQIIESQLRGSQAEGTAIVGLYASEVAIYQRYGFGIACTEVLVTLSSGQSFDGVPTTVREAVDNTDVRIYPVDSEMARAAWAEFEAAWAPNQLCAVTTPEWLTKVFTTDLPVQRVGSEPVQAIVARRDGRVVGCAELQRESKWDDGSPNGTANIYPAAVDDAGLLALLEAATSLDLIGTVKVAKLAEGSVVFDWVGGHRAIKSRTTDAVWLRIVDVVKALTERGYAANAAGSWALKVVDPMLPDVAGTYRLTVHADGVGVCERVADETTPDVTVPVAALGVLHFGARTWQDAARSSYAGKPRTDLVEHRAGALAELTAAWRRDDKPVPGSGF